MLFRVHVKLRASSLLVFWFTFFLFLSTNKISTRMVFMYFLFVTI